MLEARKTQPAPRAAGPAVRRGTSQATTQLIDETVIFDGGAGTIIRLILRNVIFTTLTLGLYSFWGKTRLRRHFLGQTVFLGSRFEYNGNGARLFVGYTAAFLTLVGLTAVCVVAWQDPSIFATLPVEPAIAVIGVSVLCFISMLCVFHFAAFRANRYSLSQISWRGFNMTQSGSAFGYMVRAVPYSLLVILTLGLAYPFMRNRLQAYKIDHARVGRERLHYHSDADPLLRCWLLPWAIGMGLMVGIVMAMETQFRSLASTNWLEDSNLPVHAWNTFVEEQTWLVLSGFILFSLAMYWYRSVESLHFANNTTLGRLRFISRLSHADFLIAWVNSVVLVAILGAVSVAVFLTAGTVMVTFMTNAPAVGHALAALIFLTLAVIVLLLGSVRWFIMHNLLAGASHNGLAIKGRIALDRLVVNQRPAGMRREPTLDATFAQQPDEAPDLRPMVNNPL